jgi:hypothetical protein
MMGGSPETGARREEDQDKFYNPDATMIETLKRADQCYIFAPR